MFWGSGGIAPCILNLGTRRRLVVSFMPQGRNPQYPYDRMLGGPQGEKRSSETCLSDKLST